LPYCKTTLSQAFVLCAVLVSMLSSAWHTRQVIKCNIIIISPALHHPFLFYTALWTLFIFVDLPSVCNLSYSLHVKNTYYMSVAACFRSTQYYYVLLQSIIPWTVVLSHDITRYIQLHISTSSLKMKVCQCLYSSWKHCWQTFAGKSHTASHLAVMISLADWNRHPHSFFFQEEKEKEITWWEIRWVWSVWQNSDLLICQLLLDKHIVMW
jgi:hypothetical protein